MDDVITARASGWKLDEFANAGRENLDGEHAWRYDAKEDAEADAELELLQAVGLDANTHLVDLGAGTGQFALAAAAVCARVVAVDVSPVMLAPLRAKLATERLDNVEVVEAGFLSYEHRGPGPAVVYSRFALHHLPDTWKALALARVRTMLPRGGLLRLWDVVYDFPPEQAEDRFEAWCAAYDDVSAGGWTRADVEEHIRVEHSTFTWILEPMLERSGFVIEHAEHSGDGLFARYLVRAA